MLGAIQLQTKNPRKWVFIFVYRWRYLQVQRWENCQHHLDSHGFQRRAILSHPIRNHEEENHIPYRPQQRKDIRAIGWHLLVNASFWVFQLLSYRDPQFSYMDMDLIWMVCRLESIPYQMPAPGWRGWGRDYPVRAGRRSFPLITYGNWFQWA